jgi:hypothetical protein
MDPWKDQRKCILERADYMYVQHLMYSCLSMHSLVALPIISIMNGVSRSIWYNIRTHIHVHMCNIHIFVGECRIIIEAPATHHLIIRRNHQTARHE